MILVDSSVWIASFKGHATEAVAKLDEAAKDQIVVLGDLILLEILQGTRDDRHAKRLQISLQHYEIVPLLNGELAIKAAHNYRKLRSIGVTIRKTNDLIIGTFCIEHGYSLLHEDRDFLQMERHLGLIAA